MYRIKIWLGWTIAVFGGIMTAIWLERLAQGQRKDVVMMGFVVLGFCAAGIALIRVGRREAKAAALHDERGVPQTAERVVLHLATQHKGTVTAALVAAHSALSFDEAQAELDKLAPKGACDVDTTDSGAVIYRFAGLLPEE